MTEPTPSVDKSLKRRFSDFETLVEAVEYAAQGKRGLNFYDARGNLKRSLPYSEMRDMAEAMGRKLVGMGFEKGARIAMIAETSAEFVAFFMGCAYASVLPVPMPLPTSFGGKEGYVAQLNVQLQSSKANAIMAPAFMNEILEEAKKGTDVTFTGDWDHYMAQAGDADPRLPTTEDVAYLQYSSGSTRFPHGIVVTHKSLMANNYGMGYHGVNLQDDDRITSWLPFYHDMGLVGTLLTSVTCQLTADFIPTEEFARRPLSWLRVLTKNKGTISYSPTFGYDVCARRAGTRQSALEELDLSSWRIAGIGAEMIRPDVMRFFLDTFKPIGFKQTALLPSYGLAECTLGVSFGDVGKGIEIDLMDESLLTGETHLLVNNSDDAPRMREVVNCGKPMPEYEVEIRSTEDAVLNEKQVGQIFVRGTSVMREYFNDPDSTAACLSADGWLNTGDMGYLKNGYIYIVGRVKDMIIVNGKNHWPQDIEWAAEQLQGVKSGDVAAISVPGEQAEEIPLILVQCRVSDTAERLRFIDELKKHVQRETGINVIVELVAPRALPRTSSGKLSRVKARNQFLSGQLQALAS
ncbi:fatty acyl-AMP ligase [Temperatibacter marinus]|uniref:Fatty acyl-AMP ligase n=1 Tax=Temperatibacter marinus TaxID=1456591 RepID=A0AA52EDZ1_9PROT|nr:fatty acyl-AMP ligase [Temperatibacter marinus]WND01918.1 fatty acyl-AMP ligase [Temperatibacter marinus]